MKTTPKTASGTAWPASAQRRRREARCFSLTELLIAMAILSIMMLLLFQYLVATQQAFSLSDSTSRIYENSRVAFEVIERDLTTMVTSHYPGEAIGYYVGNPDPLDATNCLDACLVCSREPLDDASNRLAEISYQHHNDPREPDTRWILGRQMVSSNDSVNWDFFNLPGNWYRNGTEQNRFQKVIGGVSAFGLIFYDSADNMITLGSDTTTSPSRVVINLSLFDERLANSPEVVRAKTERSFSKVLFLDQIIKKK